MTTVLTRLVRPIRRICWMLSLMPGALLLVAVPSARAAAAKEPVAKAAPPAADTSALGQGLDYLRARTVPGDLSPERAAGRGPLVLDLRFATVGANDGFSLANWLGTRARANAPVLVLFNAGTQPALIEALAPGYLPANVITLGPADTGIPADIVVPVDAAADRTAYDAYTQGTALSALISPATDKQRFDEAELIRRDAAEAAAKSAPAPAPTGRNGSRGRGSSRETPVVDLLLQRAVQLHRSLLALGRLK
jgi:hypothetical protein